MQPVQNITVDDRVSRTQYQYTLEDPDIDELNLWTGRKFVDKLQAAYPGLWKTWLPTSRMAARR